MSSAIDKETPVIKAEPLTAEAFAPFGDVVEGPDTGRRRYFDEILGDTRQKARLRFWVSRIPAVDLLPVSCEIMERHPCGSQTFVPMCVSRFLVVVAPALNDHESDPSRLKAFVGRTGQGVTYGAGVWHHGMIALDMTALFAVLMWKDEGPLDEIFVTLARPVSVNVEPAPETPR